MVSAAVSELAPIYAERGIKPEDVAPLDMPPLAADSGMEDLRKAALESSIRAVSLPLAKYSNELLFADLWLHPDLAPRDRSPVALAAIWAIGLEPLLDYRFARALDSGVTKDDISEALVFCAFHIGWPRAMAAAMTARKVLEGRGVAASKARPRRQVEGDVRNEAENARRGYAAMRSSAISRHALVASEPCARQLDDEIARPGTLWRFARAAMIAARAAARHRALQPHPRWRRAFTSSANAGGSWRRSG